ncbi:hypothetical protein AB0A63_07510 [Lentzea sp. NPDC042327]|uniref:hypothetical protein n=1 Tax=Lentzea sp. NPDC042327 TaxID=3154801 RepID=UPI0033EEA130
MNEPERDRLVVQNDFNVALFGPRTGVISDLRQGQATKIDRVVRDQQITRGRR